ncbi:hypothetical protein Vafri_6663, partial [Volvox africanus]
CTCLSSDSFFSFLTLRLLYFGLPFQISCHQVIELVLATDMKQHFATLTHFNTVHHLSNNKSFAAINSSSGDSLLKSAPGGRLANVQLELVAAEGGGGGGGTAAGGAPAVSTNSVIGAAMTAAPPEAPKPLDDSERLLSLQVLLKVADLGHLAEELDVHKRWLSALEEEFFLQGDEERQRGLPISPLFDREKQGVSKSQVGFFEFVALPLAHALTSVFPGVQPMMDCLVSNYRHWRRVDREAVIASPRNQTCATAASTSSTKAATAAPEPGSTSASATRHDTALQVAARDAVAATPTAVHDEAAAEVPESTGSAASQHGRFRQQGSSGLAGLRSLIAARRSCSPITTTATRKC